MADGEAAGDVPAVGSHTRARSKPRAESWTHRFIAALAASYGDATAAAKHVGKSRQSAYERRENDADFRAAWESVTAGHNDALEQCMARRAIEGDRRSRIMRNGEIEETVDFDTPLQIFLARVRLKDRGYNISPSDTAAGMSAQQLAAALRTELGSMEGSVPKVAAPAIPAGSPPV